MAWLKTRVGTFYDKEILKYPTGLEATRNVVIDSTAVAVDSTSGRYVLQAGTLLVNNTGQTGINAVQTLSVPSDSTSGSLQLILPMQATPGDAGGSSLSTPINYNTTAADLQAALEALPNVGAGDVTVTEAAGNPATPTPNVYTITFVGRLAGAVIPQLQVVNNSVAGGTGAVATTVSAAGRAAESTGKVAPAASSGVSSGAIVGILTHTVEFFYPTEPNVTDEPAAAYFHQCVFDTSKLINVVGNLSAVQAALPTCLFQ